MVNLGCDKQPKGFQEDQHGKKVRLLAFEGDPMCCIHIFLNALDMKEKGYDVKVVIEGTATKAAAEMN